MAEYCELLLGYITNSSTLPEKDKNTLVWQIVGLKYELEFVSKRGDIPKVMHEIFTNPEYTIRIEINPKEVKLYRYLSDLQKLVKSIQLDLNKFTEIYQIYCKFGEIQDYLFRQVDKIFLRKYNVISKLDELGKNLNKCTIKSLEDLKEDIKKIVEVKYWDDTIEYTFVPDIHEMTKEIFKQIDTMIKNK